MCGLIRIVMERKLSCVDVVRFFYKSKYRRIKTDPGALGEWRHNTRFRVPGNYKLVFILIYPDKTKNKNHFDPLHHFELNLIYFFPVPTQSSKF